MKTKKNKEIFLPLELYESLLKDVMAYQKIQQDKGVAWVSVKVNAPEGKKKKAVK